MQSFKLVNHSPSWGHMRLAIKEDITRNHPLFAASQANSLSEDQIVQAPDGADLAADLAAETKQMQPLLQHLIGSYLWVK